MTGLTSGEAAERLAYYGPNDPVPRRRRSAVFDFLRQFLNPLVLILLIAAIASFIAKDATDASIIIAIVVISNTLDFVQTRRSQNAVEQLRAQVAPTATVLRDGRWCELNCTDIAPGDVVRLSAGDLVPADAQLLESRDLYVQQAALTGESLPVEKQANTVLEPDSAPGDNSDSTLFLGTSIVSGTARAIVVATGTTTRFGEIAARLSAQPQQTAFDRGLRDFSTFLSRTVLFLVLFLLLMGLVKHRNPLQSLEFAVALAVGLTPEFLPMIVSVTLGSGARAMAKKKVIVKHVSAIQNFGSIDILCSDKTGTLTSGTMTVDACLDCFGRPNSRVLTLARLNAQFETGIHSPLDEAILRTTPTTDELGYSKCDEIPYDFERRRLSIVVQRQAHRLLITKGAPEGILPCSTSLDVDGTVRPIDPAERTRLTTLYEALSRQGLRVLAVAYAEVASHSVYSVSDETNLVLTGFVTFADKPLPDVGAALAALRDAGVRLKIITGDSDLVTAHVCQLVGIAARKIICGNEIERMTDSALAAVAEQTTVFARASPAQKTRVLLALKARGHVVAFMGDGINDAPSLRAADVGISVASAVDVARAAADIILLNRGLDVLASGIAEGRKAFGNVMKYILMGTSSNFGNMFSMAGASVFLPFLPMLPTQILLNNFLYDLSQLTIPSDNVDDKYLLKPTQWNIASIRRFMWTIGPISSLFDFLTFYVLLQALHANQMEFHTGWFVESLATQTLVIYVIRTSQNPLVSKPSRALLISTLLAVTVGLLLPYSGAARELGFVPLPGSYLIYLGVATALYLMAVRGARQLLQRQAARAALGWR